MAIWDLVIRILVAAALGGLIGLERELRDRAAGFRTHILVGVGAAAFTIASANGFDPWITSQPTNVSFDPSRIAAQIVTGVGFLGAGAIIRHRFSVRGLTTAASLWAAAAVGMAAGLGLYVLAAVTSVVVVLSLYALRFIEGRIILPRTHDVVDITVRFKHTGFGPLSDLVQSLDDSHITIRHMRIDPEDRAATHTIHLTLELPAGMRAADLVQSLTALRDVAAVSVG
jgi:putative Mg2+ transporter-C (MgtC) family protein